MGSEAVIGSGEWNSFISLLTKISFLND